MRRFPDFVRNSMNESGASVTCLPVQFDGRDWEAAIFFSLEGPECKQDRRVLNQLENTIPVSFEAEVIEHANAAIIVVRFQAYTNQDDPLTGEVLLAPGEMESHFQTVKLLSQQPVLKWFFSDAAYFVIHSQQNSLGETEHAAFAKVLDDAVRHDALIRITGRYDVGAAIHEVVSHYALRR